METGSLITPLSRYRIVTLDDNFLKISTQRITHIDAVWLDGQSFLNYSGDYFPRHLDLFFNSYLVAAFKLPAPRAEASLPCLKNASIAQFASDEKLLPPEAMKIEELENSFPGNPVVEIIKCL